MSELLTLVVTSKKALQQAETVCSQTNIVSRRSSDLVIELLASEAKVDWLTESVNEQLNQASLVAQEIHQQRGMLQERASQWDSQRNQRAYELDSLLENLALQLVPPTLHENTSSSLFGSQHSSPRSPAVIHGSRQAEDKSHASAAGTGFIQTAEEIRKLKGSTELNDRSKWKSLRDFVDEKSINEAADAMDIERSSLESLLASTASHPAEINRSIAEIRSSLPVPLSAMTPSQIQQPLPSNPTSPVPAAQLPVVNPRRPPPLIRATSNPTPAKSFVQTIVSPLMARQDALTTSMAHNLESLARHYEQISGALRNQGSSLLDYDSSPTVTVGSAETYRPNTVDVPLVPVDGGLLHERGVDVPPRSNQKFGLTDEDMQVFAGDTDMLPDILLEIENDASQVNDIQDRLQGLQDTLGASLTKFASIVDMLDLLAHDMSTKLYDQQQVEGDSHSFHETLNAHLELFDEVSSTYVSYHLAYQGLLLEMERRRRARDVSEEVVEDLLDKLEQMRDDEIRHRERFIAEQGGFLPDDLCPFVGDQPLRWAMDAVGDETLPHIQESLLQEARQRLGITQAAPHPDHAISNNNV